MQTSRGKSDNLHRIPAEFTPIALDGYGLRGVVPTRPAMTASLFGSCPSGHGFATRFLQTLPHNNALALH